MKNFVIFLLCAIVAAMAWWIFTHPPKTESPIAKQAKENVRLEAEIISRKVSEKGIETVVMEETRHVMKQVGLSIGTDSARIIDSLQKIANGRLISYTQARAEIKRLQAIMEETDTSFVYRDKWLTVDVTKPFGGRPPLLNHMYNAELNWMWYNDRKRILGVPYDTRTYGRFWLADTAARITGLRHIRIDPPEDSFSLKIQAIGEYHPRHGAGFGGGVRIQAGRMGLQGAYLWDGQRWYPAFRGSYDLIAW